MARHRRRRRDTVDSGNAAEEPRRAENTNDQQGSNAEEEENEEVLASGPLEQLEVSGITPKLQYVKPNPNALIGECEEAKYPKEHCSYCEPQL